MSAFQRISRFSQIPAQLKYPATVAAKLSVIHSTIIDITLQQKGWFRQELQQIVRVMNTATYRLVQGDTYNLNTQDILANDVEDDMTLRALLDSPKYHLYIEFRDIHWASDGIAATYSMSPSADKGASAPAVSVPSEAYQPAKSIEDFIAPVKSTPKEDLYIKPPLVPRFDVKRIRVGAIIGDTTYCVYESLPDVPKRQADISMTTDVSKMTTSELLNLFPNCRIHTRAACMYEPCGELELHPVLGLILPILEFTRDQLIDNLIKYPHIYKLMRLVDDKLVSFYTNIEICGQLERVCDIWSTLPDVNKLPYNTDFVKEYVVRRYLLERDILHINHVYPLFGALEPFLTLFTTPQEYESLGYSDAVQLAHDCVCARVNYKASRNPVMRRLRDIV